jgi:hypothetical protein
MGSVELRIAPALRIADVCVRPDANTGRIPLSISLQNDTPAGIQTDLRIRITPAIGGPVLAEKILSVNSPPATSRHDAELTLSQFRRWDIDDPYLYRVEVLLETKDGTFRDESSVRCGFREFKIEKGFFYLNGRRIFLKSGLLGDAHFPIGQRLSPTTELLRRDLVMAKAVGYNMVRFIAGMALPEQLTLCDEIGLLVCEECRAGWCLAESPHMAERFDRSVREMVRRDHNHPGLVVWGLLNETLDGPVFRKAVEALNTVRAEDQTRLVFLSSGRWDAQPGVGSICNPGNHEWEHQWGIETPGAAKLEGAWNAHAGGCVNGMGDIHAYPNVPQSAPADALIRTLGRDTKPVFLSEYGIGSMLNAIRGTRWFEQFGARRDLPDHALFRSIAEKFEADWNRWGFAATYPFPEDAIRASEAQCIRQRGKIFDLVRSNPNLCGYSITEMADAGISGAGSITFWREWKPRMAETFSDGWAGLRWCLFAKPHNLYVGQNIKLEAVLANEDILKPGEYPVTFRVFGPAGCVWEKQTALQLPVKGPSDKSPLAVQALCEDVVINGPAGEYTFAAEMERGGAPAGGRLTFRLAERPAQTAVKSPVRTWGVGPNVTTLLTEAGIKTRPLGNTTPKRREVIVVGLGPELEYDSKKWHALARQMAAGSMAVFLSPKGFRRSKQKWTVGRLNRIGVFKTSLREFEVPNVPKEEWEIYSREFWENIHYEYCDAPAGEYTLELGFCEGFLPDLDARKFHIEINGEVVDKYFDIVREAGGWRRALVRRFTAHPRDGKITLRLRPVNGGASLSRLRIFDAKNHLVAEDAACDEVRGVMAWLPLVNKGRCYEFWDWLYHKECVAKRHPIFEGPQPAGLMDWDYYGPVISHTLMENQDEPAEVLAAAFSTGHIAKGGYAAGLMMTRHTFGHGNFILNTLNILDNIGRHPAADQLLINLIRYASSLTQAPTAPLPDDFPETLKAIRYDEE